MRLLLVMSGLLKVKKNAMTAFERADFSRESDLIKSFQKILSTIAGFNVMQITLRCRVNNRLRGNNCFNLVKLGKRLVWVHTAL
ncbi:hypothetical protein BFX86_03725 [Enterobacter hormaechei]|nr:hypothetical protein BFX86_03725 [Enterobacter hormaechei]RAZ58524.1 hypothetical protein DP194_06430 [Enterobacter hormaechei subsp. xiangfangensis]RTP50762.1 hypothetical protein EKN37_09355 [Enterobacter hormaechei]TYS98903.1 hypothetical protein FYK60_09535 [Enterobacter hormaechei]